MRSGFSRGRRAFTSKPAAANARLAVVASTLGTRAFLMISPQCTSRSPFASLIKDLRVMLMWRTFLGLNFFFLPRFSAAPRWKVLPPTARWMDLTLGASMPRRARTFAKRSAISVVGKCRDLATMSSSLSDKWGAMAYNESKGAVSDYLEPRAARNRKTCVQSFTVTSKPPDPACRTARSWSPSTEPGHPGTRAPPLCTRARAPEHQHSAPAPCLSTRATSTEHPKRRPRVPEYPGTRGRTSPYLFKTSGFPTPVSAK